MALLIISIPELEVHTATYGPGIDQSQHAKSVSRIIRLLNHNIHEKLTVDQLPKVRVRVFFIECLEIVWKT